MGSCYHQYLWGSSFVCRPDARHEATLSSAYGLVVDSYCAQSRGICDGVDSGHHVQHWLACGRFVDACISAFGLCYRGRLRHVGIWMALYILISSIIPVVSYLLVGLESGLANLPMEIPTITVIVIYAWMQRRVLIPYPADTARA